MIETILAWLPTDPWFYFIALALLICLGAAVIAGIIFLLIRHHAIFIPPVLKLIFLVFGQKTGIWIRFDKAGGNLFKQQLWLEKITLRYQGLNLMDATAKRCDLVATPWMLFRECWELKQLQVTGLELHFQRRTKKKRTPMQKPFVLRDIRIQESVVYYDDSTREVPAKLALTLNHYHCEQLESDWAIFDLVFRSRVDGDLNGTPFAVTLEPGVPHSISRWTADKLPIGLVAPYVDGALDLFQSGKMDLVLESRWQGAADSEIQMQCDLLLLELMPARKTDLLAGPAQVLTDAMRLLVNAQVRELPVSFDFAVQKSSFLDLMAIDTTGLVQAFSTALRQAVAERSTQNINQLRDLGQIGLGLFNDIRKLFE